MGIYVEAYVVVTLTEAEFAEAQERCEIPLAQIEVWHDEPVKPAVAWASDDRLYDIGYERGPWSKIREALIELRETFPGLTVHYHGDSWGGPHPMTAERMAKIDAHHQGIEGQRYRGRIMHPWTEPAALEGGGE